MHNALYCIYQWLWLICFASMGLGACKNDRVQGLQTPHEPGNPSTIEPLEFTTVYEAGTETYFCFRIPAIVKSNEGTLLAFAEGRRGNCSDEDDIDLVLRRSEDGGKTRSSLITVWDDGPNTCGDPAPAVDQETGKIHLLMTWNLGEDRIGTINDGTSKDTRRVFYTWSDDDGLTWSEVEEITSSVKRSAWGWYVTGPCHGLQISRGEHSGRLVIPCDYIEVGPGRKGYSHVFYSDDNGATWELGGVTPFHALDLNESTVAESSDGRLMLNMRCSGSPVRMVSTSADGGASWEEVQPAPTLIDPVCQGSLLNHDVGGVHTLFFSNAASSRRENMTVKMSETSRMMVWAESGGDGSQDNQAWLRLGDNTTDRKIRFCVEDGSGSTILNIGQGVSDDVWHHMVCVRQGLASKVYIHGEIVSEASALSARNVSNSQPFKIGAQESGGGGSYSNYFSGQIDDFIVFNRALTDQEIKDLFNL